MKDKACSFPPPAPAPHFVLLRRGEEGALFGEPRGGGKAECKTLSLSVILFSVANPFSCYRTVNGVFNLEFNVVTSQGAAVLLQKYNFIGG